MIVCVWPPTSCTQVDIELIKKWFEEMLILRIVVRVGVDLFAIVEYNTKLNISKSSS